MNDMNESLYRWQAHFTEFSMPLQANLLYVFTVQICYFNRRLTFDN